MPITLKLAGQHNVVNALAAIAVGLALGLDLETDKAGIGNRQASTGRLQPLVGRLGNIVIDDTYNANSASFKAGLDVLKNCAGEPWLVLGAFGELGPESPFMHEEMGDLLNRVVLCVCWLLAPMPKVPFRFLAKEPPFLTIRTN